MSLVSPAATSIYGATKRAFPLEFCSVRSVNRAARIPPSGMLWTAGPVRSSKKRILAVQAGPRRTPREEMRRNDIQQVAVGPAGNLSRPRSSPTQAITTMIVLKNSNSGGTGG
jgi:hypothetical protein